jgi:hypothetical protein
MAGRLGEDGGILAAFAQVHRKASTNGKALRRERLTVPSSIVIYILGPPCVALLCFLL